MVVWLTDASMQQADRPVCSFVAIWRVLPNHKGGGATIRRAIEDCDEELEAGLQHPQPIPRCIVPDEEDEEGGIVGDIWEVPQRVVDKPAWRTLNDRYKGFLQGTNSGEKT